MIKTIKIGSRLVGPGEPCFIIAEAGVNHNGDISLAHKLIDAAVQAGADAIKFQSFITEELITTQAPKADYQVDTTGEGGGQYKMLKALELSAGQQAELKAHCDKAGIVYLCTPYENASIDHLDRIGVAAYKVASTDTNNIPFLRHMATKKRPVIFSTGMSTLSEVEESIHELWKGGLEGNILVLQCTTEYPAPARDANLKAMKTLEKAFACPVGFSDHTPGLGVSPWAVAAGACAIEKHFTLDRSMKGPDHRASMEPRELAELVKTVREVESALGDGVKRPMPSEAGNKLRMQKSLVARRPIRAGEILREEALTCKRPGVGLAPSWMDRVVGRKAARDITPDGFLTLSSVVWDAADPSKPTP